LFFLFTLFYFARTDFYRQRIVFFFFFFLYCVLFFRRNKVRPFPGLGTCRDRLRTLFFPFFFSPVVGMLRVFGSSFRARAMGFFVWSTRRGRRTQGRTFFCQGDAPTPPFLMALTQAKKGGQGHSFPPPFFPCRALIFKSGKRAPPFFFFSFSLSFIVWGRPPCRRAKCGAGQGKCGFPFLFSPPFFCPVGTDRGGNISPPFLFRVLHTGAEKAWPVVFFPPPGGTRKISPSPPGNDPSGTRELIFYQWADGLLPVLLFFFV